MINEHAGTHCAHSSLLSSSAKYMFENIRRPLCTHASAQIEATHSDLIDIVKGTWRPGHAAGLLLGEITEAVTSLFGVYPKDKDTDENVVTCMTRSGLHIELSYALHHESSDEHSVVLMISEHFKMRRERIDATKILKLASKDRFLP